MLIAAAPRFADARSVDPARFVPPATEHSDCDGWHLMVPEGGGAHRLWLCDADANRRLAALVPLDDDILLRINGLLRFHQRLDGKKIMPVPRALRMTRFRRERFILLLRALDGHLAGATRREIAAVLLDPAAHEMRAVEWKSSAQRRHVSRLIDDAVSLMNGGYLRLLRGRLTGR